MATVTDSLITLLKLQGGASYSQQMLAAAKSTDELAKAQAAVGQQQDKLKGFFSNIAGVGAIALGVKLFKDSAAAAADYEQHLFRTTVVLRNLGSKLPIEEIKRFGDELANSTTAGRGEIVETVGVLKRFGAADRDVEGLTKALADLSAGASNFSGENITLQHAAIAVGHALQGNGRILRNLGIDFKRTGDRARDLAQIREKIEGLFGGAAAAKVNTLGGSMERLSNAWQHFLAEGSVASRLVDVINALATALNKVAENRLLSGGALGGGIGALIGGGIGTLFGATGPGALIGGAIGGLLGLISGAIPGRKNAAEQIGTGKSRLATEDTLQEIAKNTAQLSPFIRQVIGGTGEVARRSFSYRDARMAFGI